MEYSLTWLKMEGSDWIRIRVVEPVQPLLLLAENGIWIPIA